MASVRFDNATRVYPGSDHASVDGLSVDVATGEFVVLLGPVASGKSTALRMLAGLEEVTSGRILIDDVDVTHLPPKDRDVAMVFQNYALYPHMTVADNMGFALRIAGVQPEEIAERVRRAARILELESKLDSRPQDLSGGERQRVAMGRAIVREPRVFLMDEPLNNLESDLREQTRDQIGALQSHLGITTLYTTADQAEALLIGGRVAVLDSGHLEQFGTADELRNRPASLFVALYVGAPRNNAFVVPVRDQQAWLGEVAAPLSPSAASSSEGVAVVTVRPEHLHVATDGSGIAATVIETVTIDGRHYARTSPVPPAALGSAALDDVAEDLDILNTSALASLPDGTDVSPGDEVVLTADPHHLHVFHARTGLRIGS